MSISFCYFWFTIVMSFVGELLDVNIKKEMSEEVKDLEANVSNISVWILIWGVHRKTGQHVTVHVFRHIIYV